MNTENKSLRDLYFDGEIFKIGDIVRIVENNTQAKVLDRGANYVTIVHGDMTEKKWLNEICEIKPTEENTTKSVNFELSEAGTIVMFGYETRNFDADLSELVLEQFKEFDDLYSQHQIVKCLDYAINNPDDESAYELVEKVQGFYNKQNLTAPFIVEALKTDIERRRLAEIIAAVADIRPSKSVYQTVSLSIKELKNKYHSRKQWEVLWPLFKLAVASGMDGIMQNLPYTFGKPGEGEDDSKTQMEDIVTYSTIEDNLDLILEDLDDEDLLDTFTDEEMLSEVLSIEARNKLSRKMAQHEPIIANRRARALSRTASNEVLLARARRLAETMVKRRMFHKSAADLSRQEKERFEKGAFSRRAMIAKLAQRLIGKVRSLQAARLHSTPQTHIPNHHKETSGAS